MENGEVENRESEDSSSMRSTERKVSQREPLSEGQLPSLAVWLSCMVRRTESLEKKTAKKTMEVDSRVDSRFGADHQACFFSQNE